MKIVLCFLEYLKEINSNNYVYKIIMCVLAS
jgi:hypothetical protein